jgi:hypothetical protein
MTNTRRISLANGDNPMHRKFKTFYIKVAIMIVVITIAHLKSCSATGLREQSSQKSPSVRSDLHKALPKVKKKNRFSFDRNCVPKRKPARRKRTGNNHFR